MLKKIPFNSHWGATVTDPNRITDPDVQALAAIATTLQIDSEDQDSSWLGSPFAWIRTRQSKQRGVIGERLVAGWLAAHNFAVGPAPNAEADRMVNDSRVEIKFSTMWQGGRYRFQQIRDQDYDFLICLGVSPFNAHSWVFDKEFLMDNIGKVPGFKPQHGGSEGTDTAWIDVDPSNPHEWITQHGGTLRSALNICKQRL